MRTLILIAAAAVLIACADSSDPADETVPPPIVYGYAKVDSFPHDPQAFTQGLVYRDGLLYESTGRYGASTLREVELATGRVLRSRALDGRVWGEGLTLMGDRLIQLTWRSGRGFVYDRATFELLEEFRYPTEGWGLTHDGSRLILSDGSATLYFLEPETFTEVARLTVMDGGTTVTRLNELEYVDGEIWANVWMSQRIARIDPASGRVTGWIDLSGILPLGSCPSPMDVLNGIAYDPEEKRIFVTGKDWCRIFRITVTPRN